MPHQFPSQACTPVQNFYSHNGSESLDRYLLNGTAFIQFVNSRLTLFIWPIKMLSIWPSSCILISWDLNQNGHVHFCFRSSTEQNLFSYKVITVIQLWDASSKDPSQVFKLSPWAYNLCDKSHSSQLFISVAVGFLEFKFMLTSWSHKPILWCLHLGPHYIPTSMIKKNSLTSPPSSWLLNCGMPIYHYLLTWEWSLKIKMGNTQ